MTEMRNIMDFITYNSTLKACGEEYKKIVFWNRFIRNPLETILSWLPALLTIALMIMGYLNIYLAVIYAACWVYPLYIFFIQFKSSVKYHLKNRDPAESAPCTITLQDTGIIADIPSFGRTEAYKWDEPDTIYKKYGYYLFFNKSKMIVMLREADIPTEQRSFAAEYIKSHVDMNKCKILF